MKQLVQAVLLQAVKDLERDRFWSDAKSFFHSDWFITLAEIAGLDDLELDPKSIQRQVDAGTYTRVPIRAVYR